MTFEPTRSLFLAATFAAVAACSSSNGSSAVSSPTAAGENDGGARTTGGTMAIGAAESEDGGTDASHGGVMANDAGASHPVDAGMTGSGDGGARTGVASVLALLGSIRGKHTVSGQFIETGPLAPVTAIHDSTGKWLGLIGGDYWHFNTSGAPVLEFNPIAIDYWKAGGLITLTLSFPNPQSGGGIEDGQACDFGALLTAGSAVNRAWMKSLSEIAAGLQQLQAAGVVVLFRIYHESEGNWFWYGTQNASSAQFIEMWKETHDYLTGTMGLHNLVWLLGGISDLQRYPGDAYVDMVGQDSYSSNPGEFDGVYDTLTKSPLPYGMAEFGPGSPSAGDTGFDMEKLIATFKSTQSNTTFWQQWWDGNANNVGWGMAECQGVAAALSDPWVYNRGDFHLD